MRKYLIKYEKLLESAENTEKSTKVLKKYGKVKGKVLKSTEKVRKK